MQIHHIGYLTKYLAQSEAEFCALGYSVERSAQYDEIRKVNICFLVNGMYRVELIEPCGSDSPLFPLLKRYKNTPYHICYIVENLKDAVDMLMQRGYAVIQNEETAPCIDGGTVVFLMNRDVGIIELLKEK